MKTPVDFVLEQVKLPFALREYQKEDVNTFSYYENSLLALGLGLGKTVVATLVAAYKLIQGEFKGVTVLCPASLCVQWAEFLMSCGLDTTLYRGNPKQREKLDITQNFVVISYEMFQQDYDKFKTLKNFFIIDECTRLCNKNNIIFKMLQGGEVRREKKIAGKLKPVIEVKTFDKINNGCIMLTATPVVSPMDSYGLIKVKTPDVYSSFYQFERIHVASKDYFGQPKEFINLDLLKDNLFLYGKQRLVSDHLDLPPIITNVVMYDLSSAHMKLYNRLIDERMLSIGDTITVDAVSQQALFQASQKIIMSPEVGDLKEDPAAFELLDTLISSVKQFIIFSNYVNTNKKFIERYNIGGVYGQAKHRDQDIRDFLDGKLRGLAMHFKSGGVGLNLQVTENVIFSELPITPRDYAQCIGRIHRSGQTKTCVSTVLIARSTIQETLMRRLFDKDDLMREIVDTDSSVRRDFSNQMTKKELYAALKGELFN